MTTQRKIYGIFDGTEQIQQLSRAITGLPIS